MTDFGNPVHFDDLEKREDTASPKTPMQWHKTRILSLDNAPGLSLGFPGMENLTLMERWRKTFFILNLGRFIPIKRRRRFRRR